jgi:hypothetical protein
MRNKKPQLKIQIPAGKYIFPAGNRSNPPGEICFSRRESTKFPWGNLFQNRFYKFFSFWLHLPNASMVKLGTRKKISRLEIRKLVGSIVKDILLIENFTAM